MSLIPMSSRLVLNTVPQKDIKMYLTQIGVCRNAIWGGNIHKLDDNVQREEPNTIPEARETYLPIFFNAF